MRKQSRLYPVNLLCQTMQVDRRGSYRWLTKHSTLALSLSAIRRNRDTALVKQIFTHKRAKVGSRTIVRVLRIQGYIIGRYRVRTILRERGLVCRIRRRYTGGTKTINKALIFANHTTTTPTSVGSLWVTDITYIKTLSGWQYLSVVLDAYSRRVLGFRFAGHMRSELVIDTLNQCLRMHRYSQVTVHDRGSQYTSHDWHNQLKQRNITGSMSGKGNCYDNAIIERFFGTLKDALVVDESLVDAKTMEAKIQQWIVKYNYQRGHSALGYLSPVQFERNLLQQVA